VLSLQNCNGIRFYILLLPCVMCALFVSATSCIKKSLKSSPEESESTESYWKKCQDVLGPMPKLNCADGVEILVKQTIQGLDASEITSLNFNAESQLCDNPKWAPGNGENEACLPHAHIARYPSQDSSKQTNWVLLCRPMSLFPKNSFRFASIQLIGHNSTTGDTCFFEGPLNELTLLKGNDGKSIPTITSKEGAQFWQPPLQVYRYGCVSCHSPYPWIHSPAVRHLQKDGQLIVPPNKPWGKYKIVQHSSIDLGVDKAAITVLETVMPGSKNMCLNCHRLPGGNLFHSEGLIPLHLGDAAFVSHPFVLSRVVGRMTSHALRFPSDPIHWESTPPKFHKSDSLEKWNSSAERADFVSYMECVKKIESGKSDNSCLEREVKGGERSGLVQ
jgi:hypothetical protein